MLKGLLGLLCALLWAPAAYAQLTLIGVGPGGASGGGGGGSPPAYAWVYGGDIATTQTSYTTSSNSQTISSGDTLLIIAAINDNVNTDHNIQCPSGFTKPSGFANYDGISGLNTVLCWKVAGGSETGAYTGTWTTSNTLAGSWALFKFTGGNASSPVEDATVQNNGSSSPSATTVTPTATSGGANRSLVACSQVYNTGLTFSFPGSPVATFSTAGINGYREGCGVYTVGSGATGTTSITLSSSTSSAGISIVLKP